PTLVCAGGIFYGEVEGRMHVLGSTIHGKDIHIVVPKGLKLEASKYTDRGLTFVHETGGKLGFFCKNKNEVGFQCSAYMDSSEEELVYKHLMPSNLVASDSIVL